MSVITLPQDRGLIFDNLENQVMNVSEAAKFLRVSSKTVYVLVADGRIPHQRIGGSIRFYRSELVKFLKGG